MQFPGSRRHAALPLAFGWAALLAAALALNALTAPLNHDESQYVAGAALAARGLGVFGAFMSLQPPLQTWVYAPIAWAFPLDAFVAMRMLSAVLALVTALLVFRAQRILAVPARAALAATGLMIACGCFSMTGGVVRNDMLAAALAAGGIVAALSASHDTPHRAARWAAAGLCFGLAASTKLSFAPYGLFGGIFLLWQSHGHRTRHTSAYATGAAAGLIPITLCAALSPTAFVWGVLTFAATAPFDWYAAGGDAARLTTAGKLVDLLRYAAQGPLLPALAIVLVACARRRMRAPRAPLRLLLLLLLGGIAAAFMPTPAQKQYLLPILPPLFILLGIVLAHLPARPAAAAAICAPLVVMAIVGLAKPARAIAALPLGQAAALAVDGNAAWIGAQLRRYGDVGAIATLSPDRLAGSGYDVDPSFATGPFVMRSGHLLPPRAALALNVATPATLHLILDRRPPAALLSGYEEHRYARGPEEMLHEWARRHGYRALRLPDNLGVLHVCPGRLAAGIGCLNDAAPRLLRTASRL